jgi:hypothetical protein
VRIVAPGEAHARIKLLASEAGEALLSKWDVGVDETNVGTLVQGVLHDGLVLFDGDGAGRIADVATGLGVVRVAIERVR